MPLEAWISDALFGLEEATQLLPEELKEKVNPEQMTRLLQLAGPPDTGVGPPQIYGLTESQGRKTRRVSNREYSIEEIAGAAVAIQLVQAECGVMTSGRIKANLSNLRRACVKLHSFGFRYPLVQTALAWDAGSRMYVFHFEGFLVDAETGQSRLKPVLANLAKSGWSDSRLDAIEMAANFAIAEKLATDPTTLIEARTTGPGTTPSILLP